MNILLPVKDYKTAYVQVEAALPYLMMGANTVTLMHVVEPPVVQTPRYNFDELTEHWQRSEERAAHHVFEQAAQMIKRRCPSVKIETIVLHGDPVRLTLDRCKMRPVELIVLARAVQKPFHWLRRSFCKEVARKAGCRTIVVEQHNPSRVLALPAL